jgi:hypothetical protein
LRHDLATLRQLASQLDDVDGELARLSTQAPWAEQMPYLMQLPGFGLIVALTLLAAIGDIARFLEPSKLVGYAGLGASVHDSGQTHRTGHITKEGRKEMRPVLVEAAWQAVEHHPHWKAEFARLTRRMDKNRAIVAVARKLLVVVWHVLAEGVADRHAQPDRVAFKLMRWSWELSDEQRGGLSTRQFVRYHLLRLQLGDDLTHITTGKDTRRLIAPVDEILALHPELRGGD